MTDEEFVDWIKREEGVVKYAYTDHLGYLTIGVGRLIDKRKGGGLSLDEIDYLLKNDLDKVSRQVKEKLPWASKLTSTRQAVLYAMAFQLGINGLLGFKNTLRLIEQGKYDEAATNMLKSKWATQTPARAKRTAELMRKG